jgi:hypothetical protein
LTLGWMLALMALAILLDGCGSDATTYTGSAQSVSQSRPTSSDRHANSRVPPMLVSNFTLFRSPANGVPESVWQPIHQSIPGMLWAQSRRIPVSSSDAYWLVPGRRHLCIISLSRASSTIGTVCSGIRQAIHHGIADTSLGMRPPKRLIVGVAPDRARRVVVLSAGSSFSVRVHRLGVFTRSDSVPKGPERFLIRPR